MRVPKYITISCLTCKNKQEICISGMPITGECTMCRKKRWRREQTATRQRDKCCAQCSVKIGSNSVSMLCKMCYRHKNKVKKAEYGRQYTKHRYNNDVEFRLVKCLRSRLSHALREHAINKRKVGAIRHLGCTVEQLKLHLESKFRIGMTWDNYGKEWEIDHIKPLSKTKELNLSLETLCHYSNLQPLWKKENLRKLNKLDSVAIPVNL